MALTSQLLIGRANILHIPVVIIPLKVIVQVKRRAEKQIPKRSNLELLTTADGKRKKKKQKTHPKPTQQIDQQIIMD